MVPILLALALGFSVLMIFIGFARTPPETDTGQLVEERLQTYTGTRPLTLEEVELQAPFAERFVRPAINRLATVLSRTAPGKARMDLSRRLELAGRPGNLTPEDFGAVRIVAAAVTAALGLLIGLHQANPGWSALRNDSD